MASHDFEIFEQGIGRPSTPRLRKRVACDPFLVAVVTASLALVACGSSDKTRPGVGTGDVVGGGGTPGVGGSSVAAGAGGAMAGGGAQNPASVTGSGGTTSTSSGGGVATAASGASGGPAGGASATGGAQGAGGSSNAGGAGGAMGGAGGADQGSGGCTRDALKNTINGYFAAMAAHDPTMVQVASTVKFTENAKELELGDGIWKTAGMVTFHRDVLDTERCGTVSEAVIDNSGTATIFGLRLKVDAGKLSEIETIVVDPKNGFFPTPMGIVNSKSDDWETVLPADQRIPREQLQAAANAYFDLFANSSTMVPFSTPCNRLENGLQTTSGNCGSGIPAGNLMMTHRRYPVSDLEAGITVGWVLFGGGLLDFHMFKTKAGKITFINAVVGPSATSWGWPDDPPAK